MPFDDAQNLQQYILFYFVKFNPVGCFGKRINEKIQGRCCKAVEIHDERLPGINCFMLFQHLYDILDDPGETKNLAEAEPDIVNAMVNQVLAWWKAMPQLKPQTL